MSDINNILLYAAALYQVKEPRVYSIEAKILMATMHTHLVRYINLIESSTVKLPQDGMSNFDHFNTLPGELCEAELPEYETDNDVPQVGVIKRQTRWESKPHAATIKATHKAQAIDNHHYSGRLF